MFDVVIRHRVVDGLAVRAKERQWLKRAAYLQTMSLAFNPLMPVFAAISTFTALILTGNSLTVTQVCLGSSYLHWFLNTMRSSDKLLL